MDGNARGTPDPGPRRHFAWSTSAGPTHSLGPPPCPAFAWPAAPRPAHSACPVPHRHLFAGPAASPRIRRARSAAALIRPAASPRPHSRAPARQLQIVTYTGGRNRDGGTPLPGARITCIAAGVLRKWRSELAAPVRRSVGKVVTNQHTDIGV